MPFAKQAAYIAELLPFGHHQTRRQTKTKQRTLEQVNKLQHPLKPGNVETNFNSNSLNHLDLFALFYDKPVENSVEVPWGTFYDDNFDEIHRE